MDKIICSQCGAESKAHNKYCTACGYELPNVQAAVAETASDNYALEFHGTGSEYFGIVIVNWLLTICTLGIYYPWARARTRKYMYGSTSFAGDRFAFHGTGKEMFIGMLKLYALIFVFFFIVGLFTALKHPYVGIIILYLGIFALMPLAIHGAYRYRMSRTSWRGIRFGYRGNRNEFLWKCLKWIGLTVITFGIYNAWMTINMRKYLIGNIRMGDVEAKYNGDGYDFFWLCLKGYFLTIITLGIYSFWWYRDLFDYYIDGITLQKGDRCIRFSSTATAGKVFNLAVGNFLIVVLTLGIGFAWAEIRQMRFLLNNIHLEGDIDLLTLQQTEDNYSDATGADAADFFDFDLF
ncbi:hypothetical protein AGMMS49965_14710 [Bacteroidia bacterium]|nr:hypothetical protein AGMMS49965_14710 [Bacteroidia bacterium]